MSRTDFKSTTDAVKSFTSYEWIMKDWSLLYDSYYSEVTKSQEFVLTNTGGCTCQLSLIPYSVDASMNAAHASGHVQIKLSDEIDYLAIQASVSLLDKTMEKTLTVQSAYEKPFPSPAAIKLGINLTKNGIADYLTKDTLILLFELTIVKSVNVSSLQTEISSETFTTGVCENLQKIRNEQSLCDVTFVIDEEEFYAHKVILAANSAVFETMFTSGMKEEEEDKVDIVDIDAIVFEEFLNYLYTGQVTNLETIVNDLIFVADKYQVNNLKAVCENFMSAHVDHTHAIQYILAAEKLCCTTLKAKALKFIKANMQVLANAADYKILFDYPELIKVIFDE